MIPCIYLLPISVVTFTWERWQETCIRSSDVGKYSNHPQKPPKNTKRKEITKAAPWLEPKIQVLTCTWIWLNNSTSNSIVVQVAFHKIKLLLPKIPKSFIVYQWPHSPQISEKSRSRLAMSCAHVVRQYWKWQGLIDEDVYHAKCIKSIGKIPITRPHN